MSQCFFELRKQSARGSDSTAADMMRHLHTRQHVGKTIIVCTHPAVTLSATRKQWLKISRAIQRQRASTLNADKILKYTHSITHMQHMRFTIKTPLEEPEGDIYFMRPSELEHSIPPQCFTLYLTIDLDLSTGRLIAAQAPQDALIVDYGHTVDWADLGLQPKGILEQRAQAEWQQMEAFMSAYDINIQVIRKGGIHNIEAMDNALDTLLSVSHRFLQLASGFQRAVELARPLKLSKDLREQYDTFALLAHRVQALSASPYTQRFLESYNEDDTFFLYDHARKHFVLTGEGLAEMLARHAIAGRLHLAEALRQFYMGRSLRPTR